MTKHVTLIPGDGIGPEVIGAAVRCVTAAGPDIEWEFCTAGGKKGIQGAIDSIRQSRAVLKGPVTTEVGKGARSVNVALRQALQLYANVRPAKNFPGIESRYSGVDLVIIRENTEDLYAGIEFQKGSVAARKIASMAKNPVAKDASMSLKTISASASKRIARFAFEFAKSNHRKKITAVHKANIMKLTDGLFLSEALKMSRKYRKIKFEDRIVDNMAMQLVQKPEQYDVLLCPNLYGDILSDLCAGLVGGLGLAYSANYGERCALFEPVHGSAPKYAGKDVANPSAAIFSAAMLLRHIGEEKAAKAIEHALLGVLREGKYLTYDIAKKKPVGTRKMTDAVVGRIYQAG